MDPELRRNLFWRMICTQGQLSLQELLLLELEPPQHLMKFATYITDANTHYFGLRVTSGTQLVNYYRQLYPNGPDQTMLWRVICHQDRPLIAGVYQALEPISNDWKSFLIDRTTRALNHTAMLELLEQPSIQSWLSEANYFLLLIAFTQVQPSMELIFSICDKMRARGFVLPYGKILSHLMEYRQDSSAAALWEREGLTQRELYCVDLLKTAVQNGCVHTVAAMVPSLRTTVGLDWVNELSPAMVWPLLELLIAKQGGLPVEYGAMVEGMINPYRVPHPSFEQVLELSVTYVYPLNYQDLFECYFFLCGESELAAGAYTWYVKAIWKTATKLTSGEPQLSPEVREQVLRLL